MKDFKTYLEEKDKLTLIIRVNTNIPFTGILEQFDSLAKKSKGSYFIVVENNIKLWRKLFPNYSRRIKEKVNIEFSTTDYLLVSTDFSHLASFTSFVEEVKSPSYDLFIQCRNANHITEKYDLRYEEIKKLYKSNKILKLNDQVVTKDGSKENILKRHSNFITTTTNRKIFIEDLRF